MRYAAGLAMLLLASIVAVGAAEARDHGGRPHVRLLHPHHHPFVFRSFFFLGTPVFTPVPVALYPATPYPAYIVAPIAGYPACYEYQTTVIAGGFLQPAYGTTCLGADGVWHSY
ncbi:MAG TPA: hypothetical protein VJ747_17755 [Stellaceae bacterium]|nr:hypothetical protein [Stellaceae bacterium]